MKKIFAVAAAAALTMGFSTALLADKALSTEVSLCERDVLAQINLQHQHAKVDFKNKETTTSPLTGSEVQVNGKGIFTKKDGTEKKFDFTCRVNTAEGRVISANVTKTGTKD
jgi:predicted small secreted protein